MNKLVKESVKVAVGLHSIIILKILYNIRARIQHHTYDIPQKHT